MSKVNLKELEAKAEVSRKESLQESIQDKDIGGKKVFKGPFLEDWFDDYGECLLANSEAKRQAEYRKAGLDEFGRSPEQVELAKERAELLAKKAELLRKVAELDLEIVQLKAKVVEEEEPAEEAKRAKRKKK